MEVFERKGVKGGTAYGRPYVSGYLGKCCRSRGGRSLVLAARVKVQQTPKPQQGEDVQKTSVLETSLCGEWRNLSAGDRSLFSLIFFPAALGVGRRAAPAQVTAAVPLLAPPFQPPRGAGPRRPGLGRRARWPLVTPPRGRRGPGGGPAPGKGTGGPVAAGPSAAASLTSPL